ARRAEAAGLDSIWVFDHMWPLSGGKERPILEQWTTLAWLAQTTTRIGVGTMVTRTSLRHAPLMAKLAATVGAIAPGRVTITLGSGDRLSKAENDAFGLPYFAGRRRTAQLASELEALTSFLKSERVTQQHDFVRIAEL